MQRLRLSAADLERINDVLAATETAWRAGGNSLAAVSYTEDTGCFTAEDLRPRAEEPDRNTP